MPISPKTQKRPRRKRVRDVPIHGAGYRKWREVVRPNQLGKQPLCEHCLQQGKIEMATDVDHIVPRQNQTDLLCDDSNLQSLCKSCHSKKTKGEMG